MMKKCNANITQYLAYRGLNVNMLTLLGLSNAHSSTIYRMVPYIHLFLDISITFFILGFSRAHHNNLLLLIKTFSILMTFTSVSLKISCLIIHKKEVFELYELLDGHFTNLLKKDHLARIILQGTAKYRFLSLNMILSVFIVTAFYNVMPLITIISNHIHHVQPDHYIFIYPTLFPWPVPFSGFIYRLHFIYESFVSWSSVIVTGGIDSIFIFFIFLMIGQLREISYSITHIDETSDSDIIVKRCITQYCTLLKCRDNLQKIYGPIFLCMMTTNAIALCTLIYQITQVKPLTIQRAVLLLIYTHGKTIQTYMYSWCGTHLTIESEECRNAIYAANWYGDKRFMTAIMIMLQQRPLVLKACHMSAVSIDIFTKIINTTISYYFLLETLE